jgi:hypothetical protein
VERFHITHLLFIPKIKFNIQESTNSNRWLEELLENHKNLKSDIEKNIEKLPEKEVIYSIVLSL